MEVMNIFAQITFFSFLWIPGNSVLFPEGFQWKYSYHGFVSSGSLIPVEAISRFDLGAILELTATDAYIIGQLSSFNSSLYNGPIDELPEDLKPAPIPQDAESWLGIPFLINYDKSGQIESLSVQGNEPLWSVNIKRGIVSVLQLNLEQLKLPASYISEKNVYGNCRNIEYSVENEKDFVNVKKVIDHTKCKSYPTHRWNSTPKFTCQNDTDGPLMSITIREYQISKNNNNYEFNNIQSTRDFYSQPFRAKAEAQHSHQYQLFQLISKDALTNTPKLPTNLVKKSLAYEHNIHDLTQGRFASKDFQKGIVGAIAGLLDDVTTDLDEKHLDKNVVNFHRELMFLYYNLFPVYKKNLEKLYEDLSVGTGYKQETKRNLFLELLPQIGSEHSINFMKDLIIKRKLKEIVVIKMLSVFPFYFKENSEKLLSDLEVFLTLNDKYEKSIRHTAILSFATLVYQTYITDKCDFDTFEKYTLKFFNLFAESESHEDRLIYLQGLDNLQMGAVPKYLDSIVQNKNLSRHIRFLASLAVLKSAPQRSEKVFETNWPILTNKSEHLEMRVAALTNLLFGQPTKARLISLYWYMQTEENQHLYNYFYTTLWSLHKSQYPCYKDLAKVSRHVTRFLPAPKSSNWMTGNYILDYNDAERAMGSLLQVLLIGNPKTNTPNVVYLKVKNFAGKSTTNQVGIYLKLQGLGEHLQNILSKISVNINNIDQIIKLFHMLNLTPEFSSDDVHIELIVKVNEKSVFCTFIDTKQLKELTEVMKHAKLLTEYHLNHQSIVPYIKEYMEPTDLGTLLIKADVSNSLVSTRGNYIAEIVNNMQKYSSDFDFRYYTYTTNFLELYNPISDMWHGVERSKKLQTKFLFNGTLTFDKENLKVELIQNRNGEEDYLNILLHTHSYTYLVSNGTSGILQQHCPKCGNIFSINKEPVKDKITLVDESLHHNESNLQVTIFDCDSYEEIKNLFFDLHVTHQSNAEIIPIAKPLLYLMHYSDYVSYIPCHGRCGVALNIKPISNENIQLQYTLLISNTTETSSQEKPNIKYEVSSSFRQTPQDEFLKLWNSTILWNYNPEKRDLNISVKIDDVDNTSNCLRSNFLSKGIDNDEEVKLINTNLLVTWSHEDAMNPVNCTTIENAAENFRRKVVNLLNNQLQTNA